MQRQDRGLDPPTRRALLYGAAIASIVVLSLLLTNSYFNAIDDETIIISKAQAPVMETVREIETGNIPNEHPPLSDLLLHFWLPVAGVNLTLIRLPFILCYGAALIVLGFTARKLAGESAFYTTMIVGTLWPYGFHFGRVAGWYSFCFLLVAVLTLLYLRFLDAPGWQRWIPVVAVSLALVESNYFGWAIIALVAIDLVLSLPGRRAAGFLSAGLAVLIVGQLPFWLPFANEVRGIGPIEGKDIVSQVLLAGFSLYSLFVSESLAPWFWAAGISVAIAIAVALIATLLLTRGRTRRMYVGFGFLFAAMVAIQVITNKRLLFVAGWLLVPVVCALASRSHSRLRRALVTSLCIIAIAGWVGIITRKYYSALHFIEPWSAVAESAARQVAEGHTVVANNSTFLFDLNAALYHDGITSSGKAGYPSIPQVISLMSDPLPAAGVQGKAMFVRGSNPFAFDRTADAEAWFQSHCRLESKTQLFPDSGYELKKRFSPDDVEDLYRIVIEQYDCGAAKKATM